MTSKAFALILLALLAGCDSSPSCEDRGGKEVFDGIIYVPQYVNGTFYLQQYPQAHCEVKP